MSNAGRLVICPTPIGNLDDVTLRVLDTLRQADVIACEDTRRTRVLLDRYELTARLISYHEHNEDQRVPELCERIAAGATVALVSDAGTPLINDPGYVLVKACIAADLPIVALPGPAAPVLALVLSGLPTHRWCFVGFLPRRAPQLIETFSCPDTCVAFESANRLVHSLETLAQLDPQRRVVVCRELTKLHEEVLRGSASQLLTHFQANSPRGEIVLVLDAATARGQQIDAGLIAAVDDLVAAGAKRRVAARIVARLTGNSANSLYGRAKSDD